jgi:hypothetical protein
MALGVRWNIAGRGAILFRTMPTTRKTTGSRGSRPGISRIDQDSTRTHGFFARFGYQRDRSGTWRPKYRAFFGDASHGGKKKALAAAEAWLTKVERAEKRGLKVAPKPAARPARKGAARKTGAKSTAKKAARKK